MQMKQRRVVAWLTMAVFCLILLPFMKHAWLDRNQANPNYYFAYLAADWKESCGLLLCF